METLLSAVNLHKRYVLPHKTVHVLQGASFAVGAGERVAIIGRSGTGKSTLLHLLGGLDRPDQGEILMDGRSLYALRARARSLLRARQVGFVFQSYHLLPEMMWWKTSCSRPWPSARPTPTPPAAPRSWSPW